jgi:hypothetical protein
LRRKAFLPLTSPTTCVVIAGEAHSYWFLAFVLNMNEKRGKTIASSLNNKENLTKQLIKEKIYRLLASRDGIFKKLL